MSNKTTTIKKINPTCRLHCQRAQGMCCVRWSIVFHLPTSFPGFSSIRVGENPAVISLKLLHFIHINQDRAYALLHQLNTVKYVSTCHPPLPCRFFEYNSRRPANQAPDKNSWLVMTMNGCKMVSFYYHVRPDSFSFFLSYFNVEIPVRFK